MMVNLTVKQLNQVSSFDELKALRPPFSFDIFQHKTIADLFYGVQDQIDLFDQGEESDCTKQDIAYWRRFANRCQKIK